jgi:hypothetical protein
MSVAVHLDQLLSDRDMTLTELSEIVGITLANLSILKTGKAKAPGGRHSSPRRLRYVPARYRACPSRRRPHHLGAQ